VTIAARPGHLRDEAVAELHWRFFQESGALQRHVINSEDQSPERTTDDLLARLNDGLLDTLTS
jgi:hypothetical protein